jgi:hypothetical protein
MISIYDNATGETVVREMTAEEIAFMEPKPNLPENFTIPPLGSN